MQRTAIFDRNHRKYLEKALAISQNNPSRLITFRSKKHWRKAKDALDERQLPEIYLAATGPNGLIEYTAILKEVVLNPTAGEQETDAALRSVLPETEEEGLWDGEVRTLYSISHCSKINPPIPQTSLRKLSDGAHIADNYGYGYVPVHPLASAKEGGLLPGEVTDGELFREGSLKRVIVNAYERNHKARSKCISHYGDSCEVCGINFEATYGEVASGFIHVHHLLPISEIKDEYTVDPIEDLRPVCPNCHAVLHMGSPLFSTEAVKDMLHKSSDDTA